MSQPTIKECTAKLKQLNDDLIRIRMSRALQASETCNYKSLNEVLGGYLPQEKDSISSPEDTSSSKQALEKRSDSLSATQMKSASPQQ